MSEWNKAEGATCAMCRPHDNVDNRLKQELCVTEASRLQHVLEEREDIYTCRRVCEEDCTCSTWQVILAALMVCMPGRSITCAHVSVTCAGRR